MWSSSDGGGETFCPLAPHCQRGAAPSRRRVALWALRYMFRGPRSGGLPVSPPLTVLAAQELDVLERQVALLRATRRGSS